MNAGKTPPQKANINAGSTTNLETFSELYLTNLPQDVITTTEDKVRLCLSEHLKRMEKKKGWVTPLSMLISFTLILITTSFKDVGLDAATWKAIFIIADVVALVWLAYAVRDALSSVKMEDIIEELKTHSESMIKFVKK